MIQGVEERETLRAEGIRKGRRMEEILIGEEGVALGREDVAELLISVSET